MTELVKEDTLKQESKDDKKAFTLLSMDDQLATSKATKTNEKETVEPAKTPRKAKTGGRDLSTYRFNGKD